MRFVRRWRGGEERLLWSRDGTLVMRLARHLPKARIVELDDSGWCVLGGEELSDELVAALAPAAIFGIAEVDPLEPPSVRHIAALGRAVAASGHDCGLGVEETPELATRRLLDYFFTLRGDHQVAFQPIVDLRTMRAREWECLFRPQMPLLPQSISGVVDAAVVGRRPVDFDLFVVNATLERISEILASGVPACAMTFAINVLPASLLASHFEAGLLADRVRKAGLSPRQVVIECTEQQAIGDVARLKRRVQALRRQGFGFAVDDAGAGYASFNLIAALEPSIIKIDRQIVSRIGNRDGEARKALVEAFVAFSRRTGAQLVAEGIETRRDLAALRQCGVDFGQGFLLGRPASLPAQPRRIRTATAVRVVDSPAWDTPLPIVAGTSR